jgi:hypothetical protein
MPDLDMTVEKATSNTNPKSSGEIYEYPGGYQIPSGHGRACARDGCYLVGMVCVYDGGQCPPYKRVQL